MTNISSPAGVVPKAESCSSTMLVLSVCLAFGEHKWLNLAAVKQIPISPSARANALVANVPSAGFSKHEHAVCEL